MKKFSKNDNGFICEHCNKEVSPLGYTSRDHCPHCLFSKHVDIFPGDRENDCKGLLRPIGVDIDSKKGYVIIYKCDKCNKIHRNKAATDDNIEEIFYYMSHPTRTI